MNVSKDLIVLIDVGASGGLQDPWKKISQDVFVIGFEPDERSGGNFLRVGLYKEKTELDLNLTKIKTKSSIFKPNFEFIRKFPKEDRFEIVGTSRMQVDTLDNQLKERGISDVDFIKIDIQGAELTALEGASRILANSIFGLEIEVEFTEVYENQPLFSDVDKFLRKFGFELFDLQPFYWKRKIGADTGGPKGQIIYANALYFKFPEYLVKEKSKILKAISICLLYGYFDYALELCEAFKELLGTEDYAQAVSKIKNSASLFNRIPNFPGRGRLAKAFYKFWKKFRINDYKLKGEKLGNV